MAGDHWPERLWLVRHGQSQGNVAREAADRDGASAIDLILRDVDVPLSPLGERQAEATGRWFAALPDDERPEVLISSPYVRAQATAAAIRAAGGMAGHARATLLDERLREREFGVFDGLTRRGIAQQYPAEAAHRAKLGKFYHRAPGGESWADVILRLRSALNTINLQFADRRVLIVCHQVVVMCFRYVLEERTEAEILAIDRNEMFNCGISAFDFLSTDRHPRRPGLVLWNHIAPVGADGTAKTSAPDGIAGSR